MPMMKESDNMYAEALFYQIGAGKGNDYGHGRTFGGQDKGTD